MKKTLLFAGVGLGFLLSIADDGWGQAKDKKNKGKENADRATAQEYKQIQKAKELEGKVAYADAGFGVLVLRLSIPHMEPNPNYKPQANNNNQYKQMQNLYQQQAQIMRTSNPVQRQQRMLQLMAQMQKLQMQGPKENKNTPYKTVTSNKDFELPLSDKVVVRKMVFGLEYDNEGNVKEYSKEELAKLKAKDPGKPGYPAKVEDLQKGQQVHLYLDPPKTKEKAKEGKEAEGPKKKDAEGARGIDNVPRPTVRMVVILQNAAKTDMPKKKKN